MSSNRGASACRLGTERLVYEYEFDIRAALKSVHKAHTFSVDGIKSTQRRRAASLQEFGVDPTPSILHPNWNALDNQRASAACAFEQFRARAWALGELRASLTSTFRQLRHVTFVDTSDRRTEGELAGFRLASYKRRIARALANLKRTNPDLWAFGIVEISATRTHDNGLLFEPHCHLLVDNASDHDVRASFEAALKGKSDARRPVQLKSVSDCANLARVLGYFLKLVPELRTEVHGDIGRLIKGRTNHLKGPPEAEWLGWMAAIHVAELLIGTGPPANLIREFNERELQPIIEELLRRRINSPNRH
ncbi:hypothetical protein [Shinella oryzae]|uniref:Replication protein n=1 Tax=Shinella oryzae TaxID=2871820 RepID=A0ABY9K6G1_9HYPH|nr:hypothetical protein [Shinella oryzae]WLS04153.1 hypothetical protein Q9315_05915 [Shinella oryzae]